MSRPKYVATLDTERRREAARIRMTETRKSPEFQEKMHAYLASERNPFRQPEARAKMQAKAHAIHRAKGYPHLNGGNGTPAPVPQRLLAAKLGWAMEYPVQTGEKPAVFKIDIAEPTLKIGIEVDGQSHYTAKVKAADVRKTAILEAQGWKVLRFKNKEVLADLDSVVSIVLETIRSTT